MLTAVVQRLRVTFGISDPLVYASVLDLGRLWERLLRRARVPLAYTQGFNPHPRLQFAAALPVGYASECELVDILLAERREADAFLRDIASQAPEGLCLLQAQDVALDAPSPQATMRQALYRVELTTPSAPEQLDAALAALLARDSIVRERPKKGDLRPYDLRPLILALALHPSQSDRHELEMTMLCSAEGSGRPEEVVAALALPVSDLAICRTRLVWGAAQEG